MSLRYNCNACNEHLVPGDPCFHCTICPDYDLCRHCHSIGKVSPPHNYSHVLETFVVPLRETSARVQDQESYWGPLTRYKAASPIFTRLLDAIFSYLDSTLYPAGTGLLEPEKLSAAIEAMGTPADDNPVTFCQSLVLKCGGNVHSADELTSIFYEAHKLDYVKTARIVPSGQDPKWNQMPALTRNGFRKFMKQVTTVDPDEQSTSFNRLLESLPPLADPLTGVPFEYSEIPRGCLPAAADQNAAAELEMANSEVTERTGGWLNHWEQERQAWEEQQLAAQQQLLHMQNMAAEQQLVQMQQQMAYKTHMATLELMQKQSTQLANTIAGAGAGLARLV